MLGVGASQIDELDPKAAYQLLATSASVALVDVRTRAEWTFTGVPETRQTGQPFYAVEWVRFPEMSPNPAFYDDLTNQCGGELPARLFFICRSGGRSMAAAQLVSAEVSARGGSVHCTNVAEGFEGDLDVHGHRGSVNGWKAHGLPWRQS